MQLFQANTDASQDPIPLDNITDWCLELFQERYGTQVTKDDIWTYLYGVMHAPDWRERYRFDLQRSLPRVPLAEDFDAFKSAGRELMYLHIGYETCPEYLIPAVVSVEGGGAESSDLRFGLDEAGDRAAAKTPHLFRIGKMHWGRGEDNKQSDQTVLWVNDRCRIEEIPAKAHQYQVSGRSPLHWAIDSLRHKEDKASGIVDDPNGWHVWEDRPFNLIRHLRRLVYVSVRSAKIIESLPPSLTDSEAG
ncbi:MAG: hypothetical protein OXH95_01975 [bacterium]|nr:hypothetical protein [bacterium]